MFTERQDLFQFIRFLMRYAGMHPLNLERNFPNFLRGLGILFDLLYEIFLYFVIIHILILYICTIYINSDSADLELIVNCLIQTIIYLWVITVKLYFRRLQRKRLQNILNLLNLNYKPRSALGFTYVTMDDCFAMSNKWVKFFVYQCFMGTLFWLILPIIDGDRRLPLDCWYPFDYKAPVVYELIYFLQFIGQTQVSAAFSASSGFYMDLCILISGQYDVLYCSLKNILATVAINSNSSKIDLRMLYRHQEFAAPEVNEYFCCKEIKCKINDLVQSKSGINSNNFRLQFRNAIKDCVDHHCYIVKCLNKIEDFYSPIWFLKMGEVIFLACLVAFVSVKSTTANSTIIKTLSLGQYLFLITWELLIICYFGESIYISSQRCGDAILRSPWYLHMREMKFDFLLFLLNSKRSFQLTAGKILPLNIEFFKTMLTTGFSFLTLLQQMDERSQ